PGGSGQAGTEGEPAGRVSRGRAAGVSGLLSLPAVLAPVEPFRRRAEVRWRPALPRPPADRGRLVGPGLLIIFRLGTLVEEVVALAGRAIGGHPTPPTCRRPPPAPPPPRRPPRPGPHTPPPPPPRPRPR